MSKTLESHPLNQNYSHGLERIYAIETLDLKSVRPMVVQEEAPERRSAPPSGSMFQQDLPLGPEYAERLNSFVLQEPLVVLGLSPHTLQALKETPLKSIQHLIECDLYAIAPQYKIGHGHVDEILRKLKGYLSQREVIPSRKIDFFALLRSVYSSCDPVKLAVIGEEYGLGEILPLTASQRAEVKRLTHHERVRLQGIVKQQLAEGEWSLRLHGNLKVVTQFALVQWMRQRNGIATHFELDERLERVAADSKALGVIQLLSSICGKEHLYEAYLHSPENGIYVDSVATGAAYHAVLDCLQTYFYCENLVYSIDELCRYVEKEFARAWVGFSEGFIEKVLHCSPCFIVFKSEGSSRLKVRKVL